MDADFFGDNDRNGVEIAETKTVKTSTSTSTPVVAHPPTIEINPVGAIVPPRKFLIMLLSYFDPGAGSLLMQILVGGAGGLAVLGKYLWNYLVSR